VLSEAQRRADRVGLVRYALPTELGGRAGSNLAMAVVREHLNRRGIGLHNNPQSEISIVGNFPTVMLTHPNDTAPGLQAELPGAQVVVGPAVAGPVLAGIISQAREASNEGPGKRCAAPAAMPHCEGESRIPGDARSRASDWRPWRDVPSVPRRWLASSAHGRGSNRAF
jgi:hypothetical protein